MDFPIIINQYLYSVQNGQELNLSLAFIHPLIYSFVYVINVQLLCNMTYA